MEIVCYQQPYSESIQFRPLLSRLSCCLSFSLSLSLSLPPSLSPPALQAHGDTSIYLYSVGFYYDDFVWAVSAVMSRQNEIPHEREETQSKLALIPLWDMCNHWPGENRKNMHCSIEGKLTREKN